MKIHPTAIVSSKAKLDSDVEVGPYSFIGEGVRIGKGVKVGRFCVIENATTVGDGCRIFTGAVVGSIPQDLKYRGGAASLVIGKNNTIREYVTINLSTSAESSTRIADNNVIMAYSHIAHDSVVGSHCVIANAGTLAGHVTLEDKVVVGGLVAIHQFVRVGTLSIIGGCSKVVSDIPPYSTCDGHPAKFYGLNLIGLRRACIDATVIKELKNIYKTFFQSGLNKKHAVEKIKKDALHSKESRHALAFLSHSKRGICH